MNRKYSLPRSGWEVKEAHNKAYAIWRGILSVKKIFLENIKYKVGSGVNIKYQGAFLPRKGLQTISF